MKKQSQNKPNQTQYKPNLVRLRRIQKGHQPQPEYLTTAGMKYAG